MFQIMASAEVGDDVMDEDPTIHKLQNLLVELTGHEAALYCASATMTNQLAVRSHLQAPPHSVICDHRAHVYCYEAGGISYHTGAQLMPITPAAGFNYLTADEIAKHMVIDDDIHHAPTKLICLENTLGGEIFPLEEIKKISALAKKHGIKMHLDGARIWNASVATGISLKEYASHFDTFLAVLVNQFGVAPTESNVSLLQVSLCLSKGLGAPVGSVLVGSKDLIKKARHFRKMWGGGWRQAGVLAAAGLYVVEHHFPLLKNDHENAKLLAEGLVKLGFPLTRKVETNMVWVDTTPHGISGDQLQVELAKHGIKVFGGGVGESRWVLHHQTPREGVEKLLSVLQGLVANKA
ncbi:Threonine aldolase [Blyttiomyces sp. JEL0837]|nr:Threonine aldolase [Blyttiomyces sp. JEL0837]